MPYTVPMWVNTGNHIYQEAFQLITPAGNRCASVPATILPRARTKRVGLRRGEASQGQMPRYDGVALPKPPKVRVDAGS